MSEPGSKLKVAVVGGGIVGLSFAVYLAQLGKCELHVFESARAFGEIGAGIGIGHNAMKVYIEMGIADKVYELSRDMAGSTSDIWFDCFFGDGRNGLNPICTIRTPVAGGQASLHRADLLDLLVSLLPKENVYFGKHVVNYEQIPSGGVKMIFKDGTSFESDVLVAADGIKSSVRGVMYGDKADTVEPKWSGSIAYRGLIPMEKVVPLLGEHTSKTSTLWLGKSRHIVQFPVSQKRTVNIVAFVSDFEHGRHPDWKAPQWIQECKDQSEMLEDFKDWTDPVKDMLKHIEKPMKWAIFEIPNIPHFVEGHVALIGDSAHASTPHQGNGASQGIEDAHVLANLLSHPKTIRNTVPLALKVYDEIRRPRAQRMQNTSYEAVRLYEGYSAIGHDQEKLADALSHRMDWIWKFDVQGQRDKAIQTFEERLEQQ
ncbi:salicylate 1-monooxygenase [Calocera viscosa TUFC12733]|uniref:Salicylate 1-monooxygenase n=1 Tax=Calocera viscosa (strain TUFC12733) TaxID=1330018 RepID=A0A167HFA3_CALVF|nr:salicylate 1-monooxygenase [Calocera viscosa TUFC12733]